MNDRLRRGIACSVTLAGLGFVGMVAVASGHDMGGPSLVRELTPQDIQSRALASKVANQEESSGAYQVAQLFGESDQERAVRLQHEQWQDTSVTYLRQHAGDLERTVQRLTGDVEQLEHRVDQLNSRLERMQKDFDYRLCSIAQQQLNAAGGGDQGSFSCGSTAAIPGAAVPVSPLPPQDMNSMAVPPPAPPPRVTAAYPPAPASTTASSSAAPPRAAGQPVRLAPPPANLGTLPANGATPASAVPGAISQGGGRGGFDSAMRLLAKAQYDEARGAFRAFADSYPKDERAPEAVYWIGDIALVQKDYPGAAHAFAEEIKKYPDGTRAPDSMLKLGQSLIAMGQKQEGCTALAALPTKYPNATQTVIDHATQERKASACR
jgi:tol-pal system protein YbgF